MTMKLNEHDAQRNQAEARANVERLKDSEQRFRAEREALASLTPPVSQLTGEPRVESRNERHRRELDEQEREFEYARRELKREEGRHARADWSAWDRWADAKIANAIARERRIVVATIGEDSRKAIEMIYEDIAEEVKALRVEITTLQATLDQSFEQLRSMVRADKAKVIDLPNPLRRAN